MRGKTTSSETIYEDPWTHVRLDDVHFADGHRGSYAVVTKPAGVNVVALTSSGTLILVKEYRHALGDYSIEAVSGAIEPGETPTAAAHRELAEELGFVATRLTPLTVVQPFTAGVNSTSHLFLAEGLAPTLSRPDPGEYIEPVEMSLSDAVEGVVNGKIVHASSCLAILLAERHIAGR